MDYDKIMGFWDTLRKIHPDMHIITATQPSRPQEIYKCHGPMVSYPQNEGFKAIYVDHVNLIGE